LETLLESRTAASWLGDFKISETKIKRGMRSVVSSGELVSSDATSSAYCNCFLPKC